MRTGRKVWLSMFEPNRERAKLGRNVCQCHVKDIMENSFYHHNDVCLIMAITKVITTTVITSFHMYILITSPN